MCAGAIVLARIDRVVYGAADPKAGAVDTLYDLLRDPRLNHRVGGDCGVLQEECAALMRAFFRRLRKRPWTQTDKVIAEGCLSGRKRRSRKPLGVARRLEGSNPSPSATF